MTPHDVDEDAPMFAQPFSPGPTAVFAQVGWYAPAPQTFHRLDEATLPGHEVNLKPVYIGLGGYESKVESFIDDPDDSGDSADLRGECA